MNIDACNRLLFGRLSLFLNQASAFIKAEDIKEITQCGVGNRQAFSLLLCAALGLDVENNQEDSALYHRYFPQMISCLNKETYKSNPYYQNIHLKQAVNETWVIENKRYEPYEAFVFNEPLLCEDGAIIPQIGYFEEAFEYPCVLENDREWMLITPNEIETMRPAVENACGNVLTYGLGMGYYAYMTARKPSVSHVTIVEKDEHVIRLFKDQILPQFQSPDKITIIQADAYDFAENMMQNGFYDSVFYDIWHDPSDGVAAYERLKQYEKNCPNARCMYWIEKTLKLYM